MSPLPLTLSPSHSCAALDCDVSLDGVALRPLEIVVAVNGAAVAKSTDILRQVPTGASLPKRPELTTLGARDRPFTRRVA